MLWYSLEAPRGGASNEYPQHMFSLRSKNDISIFVMKKVPYLMLLSSVATLQDTVKLQSLEQLWYHGNLFEILIVQATES